MTPVKIYTILAVPLLAMACAQAPGNNAAATANLAAPVNETGAAPASTATAAPANSAAPATGPLSAYVGKLTSDAVGGSTFLARPEVRGAVESLVQDSGARRWLLNPDTTQSPIEMRGGKLYSGACEPHNCGPHQWTIAIAPDGSGAEICYHDDRQDSAHSRWYAVGHPPETRPGYCQPL